MSYVTRYAELGLEALEVGGAWRPTLHGEFLAVVISDHALFAGKRVLEIGAGVGNHTVPILRQRPEWLVVTEREEPALTITRQNVERLLAPGLPVEYRAIDWLRLPDDLERSFDVLVSNPPFCKSGKRYRRYFIDQLILDAHRALRPGGEILFVQSSMADIPRSIRLLEENGFEGVAELDRISGPFRDYYFADDAFMAEIARVPDGYQRDERGVYIETLAVLRGALTG